MPKIIDSSNQEKKRVSLIKLKSGNKSGGDLEITEQPSASKI